MSWRKTTLMSAEKSARKPLLVDLNQDEQLNIINQTGILHKLKEAEKGEEQELSEMAVYALNSILLTIPISIMFYLFEYMVHLQFDNLSLFNLEYALQKSIVVPSIFLFSFATEYYKGSKIMQLIFLASSLTIGVLVIHYVTVDETFGAYRKTPGLIAAGILLIIQMNLTYACLACALCTAYYYRHSILPSDGIARLSTSFRGGEL